LQHVLGQRRPALRGGEVAARQLGAREDLVQV
jgi:hypothetical protein